MLIALGRGVVKAHPGCGISYERLNKTWAVSFLRRYKYVKRKGTHTARKAPVDFEDIKSNFLNHIENIVEGNGIPSNLIINFDQTGCKLVPASCWTLEMEGTSQIDIKHLDDKREITVLLGCAADGSLLPPQIIYTGKTDQCHPKTVTWPTDWDITHTKSH